MTSKRGILCATKLMEIYVIVIQEAIDFQDENRSHEVFAFRNHDATIFKHDSTFLPASFPPSPHQV